MHQDVTEVVVLCGGRGTRLGTLTAETPKPLLPVGGVPFLLHRLTALKHEGVSHIILAVRYLAQHFREFAASYAHLLPQVTVIEEPAALGTGGALRHAAQAIRSPVFVALNGDSWMLQPIEPILAEHARRQARFTMVVVRADQVEGPARDKGLVLFGPQGELLGFSTGDGQADRWVNAGLYAIDREVVLAWPQGAYSLEERVMSLVPPGGGRVYCSEGRLLDIGTPDCYAQAGRVLALDMGVAHS